MKGKEDALAARERPLSDAARLSSDLSRRSEERYL